MALAYPQLQKTQTPRNHHHLSYSVFAERVLPFLYPFLTHIDPRPTFILSSNNNSNTEDQVTTLLYTNQAFQDLQQEYTVDIVQQCIDLIRLPAGPSPIIHVQDGLLVHSHSVQGNTLSGWFCFAEETPIKPPETERATDQDENYIEDDPGKELVYTSRDLVRLDWTRGWCPMAIHDSEHFQFLRTFDWASTPLGPYTKWSKSLRAIVNAIMPLNNPTIIHYGKDGLVIYNTAYRNMDLTRHPSVTAVPLAIGWPESIEYMSPIFRKTMIGIPTAEVDTLFLLNRRLEPEETYFTFQFSPLIEDDGSFMGALNTSVESTDHVIRTRRSKVTQALLKQTTNFKDLSPEGGFWDGVLEAVDLNPLDSPFAIIYRVEAWNSCRLIGGRGLPDNPNDIFTDCFDFDISPTSDTIFQRQFKQLSIEKLEYLLVEFTPEHLKQLTGMRYRGFKSCQSAVVIPFYQGFGPLVKGFFVLGLNDKRVFDDSYKAWISELAQTLWRAVDIAWAKQEDARMQREHSASVKIETEEMVMALQKTTQELKESELLFARTADVIPIGLVCLDAVGAIIYSNDTWHQLAGLPRGESKDSWPRIIYSGDRDEVVSTFTEAIIKMSSMSMEFRIGIDHTPGSRGWFRWCRNSMTPNFDEATGQLTGFVGTFVDITAAKNAAEYQRQLTIEAVESKRQQDNFIDVYVVYYGLRVQVIECTSHELRNPLSAILQSADEITQLLKTSPESLHHSPLGRNINQAASTILACGEHQKKIIDDILNVSKMDAGLLAVEPVPVEPHVVLQRIMEIFGPEFRAKGIATSFKLSSSYSKHCEKDWWSLDPARLTQIVMNLVTNAIKFTATKAGLREVHVSLDASTEPPDFKDNFQTPAAEAGAALTERSSGSPSLMPPPLQPQHIAHRRGSVVNVTPKRAVYLLVCVKDTGIGISNEWRTVMGQRYRQAPKTHISYGGSGLGLFISRQLAFLLGGELHFDSEIGVGSTFSFYVRCEQCPPPDNGSAAVSSLSSSVTSALVLPPATNASSSCARSSSTSVPSLLQRGQGMDVLVVEDNIINQKILRRQLEAQGCHVDVASNGVEALEAMAAKEQAPFTVVLMDMEMPVMGGIATTERIRANEQAMTSDKRHVPIIGTSANARTEHIDKMLLAGMDDVITKPFVINELMSKIEHVLRVQVANKNGAIQEATFPPYQTAP